VTRRLLGERNVPIRRVERYFVSVDNQAMTWWEWTILAIWGPASITVAGMLLAVAVDKTRKRLGRRRPVMIDRRRPERARLREAIDHRGLVCLGPIEPELAELTADGWH
jgi:hypothetical protein